ncbi:hypothetical protein [Frondihabitans australicus]|uniref:Uncharacterized protein n=1 Tax=Frondihabitans australicus TaxID=386892 RepID=A0A495IJQ4_9MICO|nr:hypothetical protein [Frondihabitans australicus]RKR76252.1 hypothetical protein C8E83_3418 [Frondihabitans australicus]
MTFADLLARFDALLDSFDPDARAFVSPVFRQRLNALPSAEAELLLAEIVEAAEAAGADPFERLRALSRAPFRATTPEAATHTIAELIDASERHAIVGAVEGVITNTWRTRGYTEYRVSDGEATLVIGVHGRAPGETPQGQRIIATVKLPRGASAITEPIDPAKPSVLGAVAAQVIGFRPL